MELFRAIRIPHPLPRKADTHLGICFFYLRWGGIRTVLNATVRWTVARESLTERHYNFVESLILCHENQIPMRVSGFYFRMGFERAAPVLKLVQKVSGGHFLARGRIHGLANAPVWVWARGHFCCGSVE